MKLIFIFILFISPIIVKADQPRHSLSFTSANEKYEFRHISGLPLQNWELIEKSSGKPLYKLTNEWLYTATALVSDDGNNVVAIDDYSERDATESLDVLLFFDKGKLIKKYSLVEINGMGAITYSASHFSWTGLGKDFSIIDSKINLETYALVYYTFDVKTGNILKKERDASLADDAIYIYGEIVKDLGNGKYEMDVCTHVQGTIPESGKIEFESKEQKFYIRDYGTVIIRDGKLVDTKTPYILNACNYKSEKKSKKLKS